MAIKWRLGISLISIICSFTLTSCEATLLLFSNERPTIELKNEKAYVNGVLGNSFYKKLTHFIAITPRDSQEHQIFFDLFNKIEFDTSFYWFTLRAAKANDIHWTTQEEIKRFGLATE
jgi:uncharacterized protein YktA (UPF0223 family)